VRDERASLFSDAAQSAAPHFVTPPKPETCGNCQAEDDSIYWNATGGWSCRSCGASDYEEAAE
jgi:ribosomal protein L37AE/L43A